MKKLLLFSNGNTAFFSNDKQVQEVQMKGWLQLQFEWLGQCGYNPLEIDEIILPSGMKAKPFKTDSGWNWEIK